jgi:regulator of replication initiation timing
VTGQGRKLGTPKSFGDLIANLDEVSKLMVQGGAKLQTTSESRAELAVMKEECTELRLVNQELQDQIENMT